MPASLTTFVLLLAWCLSAPQLARAESLPDASSVVVHGLKRTRESTVLELLPRPPPARYSDAELAETERRLRNLTIFDDVRITREAQTIVIELREKWTLIPALDLARGKTFKDTFLLVGATEFNFLGTAAIVNAFVYHAERGWNGELSFAQHGFHPGRGAIIGELEWTNANYRFEGGDAAETTWNTRRIGGALGWSRPLLHGKFFNYELIGAYYYELIDAMEGTYAPASGSTPYVRVSLIWNRYRWEDLTPRGWALTLRGTVGALAGRELFEERLQLYGTFWYALPLARYTVLMARWRAHASSVGNANFSALLGGLEGVRGLDDALYRNWAQTYLNLELRQSLPLHRRLALQFVAFSDAALYQQLDQRGRRADAGPALSAGLGARLVPTFLSEVVLRVDVARLFEPYRDWFVQWGLSQYF